MLLDDGAAEGCAELESVQFGCHPRGANGGELLLGALDRNPGILEGRAGLLVVLFRGNPVLPEPLLAFMRRGRQAQALLGGEQLAAVLGERRAGDDGEHITLLDFLGEVRGHTLDFSCEPWHNMGSAVFVEPNFPGKRHG